MFPYYIIKISTKVDLPAFAKICHQDWIPRSVDKTLRQSVF